MSDRPDKAPLTRRATFWGFACLALVVFWTPFQASTALFVAPALVVVAFVLGAAAVFRGETVGGALLLLATMTLGFASCVGGCVVGVSAP